MFNSFMGGNAGSGDRGKYFIVKMTKNTYDKIKQQGRNGFIDTIDDDEGNNKLLNAKQDDVILFWDEIDRAFLGCGEVQGRAEMNREIGTDNGGRQGNQKPEPAKLEMPKPGAWGRMDKAEVNSNQAFTGEGKYKLPVEILRDFDGRNRLDWNDMRAVPFLENMEIVRNFQAKTEVYDCPELMQMYLIGKGLNIENRRGDSRYRYENRGW